MIYYSTVWPKLLVLSLLLSCLVISKGDFFSESTEIQESERLTIDLKPSGYRTLKFMTHPSAYTDIVIHTQAFQSTVHPNSKISLFENLREDKSPNVLHVCNTKIFEPCFFDLPQNLTKEVVIIYLYYYHVLTLFYRKPL
jgi:hypothetical protein